MKGEGKRKKYGSYKIINTYTHVANWPDLKKKMNNSPQKQ
jgi:hypothetical protein